MSSFYHPLGIKILSPAFMNAYSEGIQCFLLDNGRTLIGHLLCTLLGDLQHYEVGTGPAS